MRLSNGTRVLLAFAILAPCSYAQAAEKVAQAIVFEDQRQLPGQANDWAVERAELVREAIAQKKLLEQARKLVEEERRKRLVAETELETLKREARQTEGELNAVKAALQKQKAIVATARATKNKHSKQPVAKLKRVASIPKIDKDELRKAGFHDRREAEALAEANKRRLAKEKLLAGRLTSALDAARRARLEADNSGKPTTNLPGLPENWAKEERKRLELEDRLRSIAAVAQNPVGQIIKLRLKGSAFEISGTLKSFNRTQYVITPPDSGDITVPADRFDCVSNNCPTIN